MSCVKDVRAVMGQSLAVALEQGRGRSRDVGTAVEPVCAKRTRAVDGAQFEASACQPGVKGGAVVADVELAIRHHASTSLALALAFDVDVQHAFAPERDVWLSVFRAFRRQLLCLRHWFCLS